MQFEATISAGDVGALIGLAVGIVTFAIQNRRELAVQKIELYHRLETGSIELFKFEATNVARLKPFQDLTRDVAATQALDDEDAFIKRKFYEQTMNLFEMAARFRKKNIIEPEIYGSWVIWYYDTLAQWGFREEWPDLRQNYTVEIRAVFDKPVAEFNAGEDDAVRKRRFFKHVGDLINCDKVRKLLDTLEREAEHYKFAPA
jgi:hypothetical protein